MTPGDLWTVEEGPGEIVLQALTPRTGSVLGRLDDDRLDPDVAGWARLDARPAVADTLSAIHRASGAQIPVGTWDAGSASSAALLRASGFNRHTFLCGQSGSGKTYALGVLLEQLLLGTELPMAVLDPNADFVRLAETRPDVEADVAARLGAADIRVLGREPEREPLRMRFVTMPRRAQAAVLRLDPLRDRAEYNLFLDSLSAGRPPLEGVEAYVRTLLGGGTDERALAQRIQNLGLPEWEVFAREDRSAAEVVRGGARVTVLDLAGFDDPRAGSAVSLDLLENLWAGRHERCPQLLVIDEAHNICPAHPVGEIQEMLVERLVQIAGEGRKYGLWLLLSTQRPSKVHPQVLSQCDNLMLMRMNSPADVEEVVDLFGFAPPEMLRRAPFFRQGEAVFAGRFAPCPMRVRMGRRLTVNGGSDVAVPLAPAAAAATADRDRI
ncbi:hypothetical protein GCM10012283_14720 [Phycicoccus endophyticus]|nr:hypothetical protein GCM10012283_14720 [Phycicoccus endophyticus]